MKRYLASAVIAMMGALAGCAGEVGVRAYDPYYRDYHVWGDAEAPYYNNWVIETHRPHVDYRRLNKHDRDEYWRWRHDHH